MVNNSAAPAIGEAQTDFFNRLGRYANRQAGFIYLVVIVLRIVTTFYQVILLYAKNPSVTE